MHNVSTVNRFQKKLITGIFLTVALLAVGVLGMLRLEKVRYESQGTASIVISTQNSVIEKDTDGDGLKDWEETLRKTDPYNKDTDGDGTSDGVEVSEGRDPLKPGPDDYLTTKESAASTLLPSSISKTATGKLARDIFSRYAKIKQLGVPIASQEEAFVQEILNTDYSVAQPDVFTLSDIQTHTSDEQSAIRTYGNALGSVITRNSVTAEHEGIILLNALEKSDPEELVKLDRLIYAYQAMLDETLDMSVPPSAAGLHLKFANSFSLMAYMLTDMRNAFNDPVAALIAVQNYANNASFLYEAFLDSEKYFSQNNIEFDQEEEGYFLTNIIDKVSNDLGRL